MKNYDELKDILYRANKAKDVLAEMAEDLRKAGFDRKADSCMNLVYKIESWQNRN